MYEVQGRPRIKSLINVFESPNFRGSGSGPSPELTNITGWHARGISWRCTGKSEQGDLGQGFLTFFQT